MDIRPSPDARASGVCRGEAWMTLSDTAWLVLAIAAGILLAVAWVSRERAIHRRRRSRGEETRK
jgi:hypothetical protein